MPHGGLQARAFLKAAEQGYPKAQNVVGAMYHDGQGVQQDYAQAYKWLTLANSRAEDAATRDLAVKNREKVAAKMTPAQVAEAQRMAREWAQSHPSTR